MVVFSHDLLSISKVNYIKGDPCSLNNSGSGQ
jgi:hypothetical protein